jgi:predicted ATP-dependent endonuclease of OLD family
LKFNTLELFFDEGEPIVIEKSKQTKFKTLEKNIWPVVFIKDQRLEFDKSVPNNSIIATEGGSVPDLAAASRRGSGFPPDGHIFKKSVLKYANEFKAFLADKKTKESNLSDKLKNSELNRIKACTPLSDDEYKKRFAIFLEKYNQLLEIGIYSDPLEYMEYSGNKQYLTVFLQDFEEKFAIYEDIREKSALFNKMLNSDKKELSNKSILLNKDAGIIAKTSAGNSIELDKLSSGEQELVVMFYSLLFKTPPASLVLIDEPETSMHIVWQRQFVSDLKEIRDVNRGLYFIVATHSPQIIAKYWDLCFDLFDLSKQDASNA